MASLAQPTRRPFPDLVEAARVLLLTAAYVAAGRFGLSLAFENPSASPVWPPTGIAIAAMLILGARVWPAVAIGAFLVNMMTTGTVASSAGIASGNTLEALLATWLVSRFANGRWAFESTRHMLMFVASAGLLSPVVSATFGVLSLALDGHLAAEAIPATWMTWWLGNAVGALIVAPVILLWHTRPVRSWTWRQALEASLWLSFFVLFSLALYGGFVSAQYLWPFSVIPLLLCISIRFGTREAATGLVLLSGIAIWGTLRGFGPFATTTPSESLLTLQSFLGMASVLTLAPAVMVSERRRAETRLQAFFDQAVVGIADCDLDCRFLRVNQHFCDMLGYTREELFARSLLDITHPDDREMTRARFERLRVDGSPNSVDKRYIRSDGTMLWVRALASRVVPGPGQEAYAATVVEDITSRKQAEEAMQKAAILEERNRLAGEIHDDLAQSLVGIVLQLENVAEVLPADGKDARRHADRAALLARTALDRARRSIQALRPSELETNDLYAALRSAADGLVAGSGVELDFRFDRAGTRLAAEVEDQLFYIGKEAITNAWRHAAPRTLTCRLKRVDGAVQLEVSDDGRGFDVGQAPRDGHFGLTSMQERAQRIGARLTIESDPGRGTSVVVRLPGRSAEAV
jgi:PAS domain S-box-containing protein